MRRLSAAAGVLLAAMMGGVAVSPPALAQTPCTAAALISAITAANSTNGTVTLTSGCTYTLTAINNTTDAGGVGLPVITRKVTIQGSGATIARSSASSTPVFRIFDVASSGSLTLNSVRITNGLANNGQQGGGGVFNNGTLTITGSTFTNNSAPSSSGTSGGGINNNGTLNLSTSTFTGNSAQEGGGVFNQKTATVTNDTFTSNTGTIYGGGALLNAAGTMTVTGSTFTGNTGVGGGAIDNDTTLNIGDSSFNANTGGTNGGGAIINFGLTTVTQTTIAGNSSPYGANILNYTGFTLKISMSIVANGQGGGPNCGGGQPVSDAGYNLDTGSTCGFSTAGHSMSNTNPQLGALASNGGPTQTMALPSGSPAVDVIPASTPGCTGTTDQRGITRPQGTGCDIGAYELVQSGSGTPTAHWVQGGAVSTGTQVSSITIRLTSPVSAGDLLVGWFGQYNSSGHVTVSDNVNGAWTRGSASTTFGGGSGDIALYYLQNSAAAPSGLTITITATSATYLEAAAADYSGIATTNALDQVAVAKGNSATPDSGPTASVGAGELVVGAIVTGGAPGTVTAGSSQGQAFTMRSQTGSGSADLEDIPVSAAGAQDARATFSSATDWYAVAAVFHPA